VAHRTECETGDEKNWFLKKECFGHSISGTRQVTRNETLTKKNFYSGENSRDPTKSKDSEPSLELTIDSCYKILFFYDVAQLSLIFKGANFLRRKSDD